MTSVDRALSTLTSQIAQAQQLTSNPEKKSELKGLIDQINRQASELEALPPSKLLSLKQSLERLDNSIKLTHGESLRPSALVNLVAKAALKEKERGMQVGNLLAIAEEQSVPRNQLQQSPKGAFALLPENLNEGTFTLVYKAAGNEIREKHIQVTEEGKLHVDGLNFVSFETMASRFRLTSTPRLKVAGSTISLQSALISHNRAVTHEDVSTPAKAMQTLKMAIEQLGPRAEGAHLFFEEDGKLFVAHVHNGMIDQMEVNPAKCSPQSFEQDLKRVVRSLSPSTSWVRDAKMVANTHDMALQGSAPTSEDRRNHPAELQELMGALGEGASTGFVIYPGQDAHTLMADCVGEGGNVKQVTIDLAKEPGKMFVGSTGYENVKELIQAIGGKLTIGELRELKTKQQSTSQKVLKHPNYDLSVRTARDAAGKLAVHIDTLKESGVKAGWLVHAAPQTKSSGYSALGALSWFVPQAVKSTASYVGVMSGFKEASTAYTISVLSVQGDGSYAVSEHDVQINPQEKAFHYKNGSYPSLEAVADAIKAEKGLPSLKSLSQLEEIGAKIDNCRGVMQRDPGFNPPNKTVPTLDSVQERLFRLKRDSEGPTYLIYPQSKVKQLSCQVSDGKVEQSMQKEHFNLAFLDSKGEILMYDLDLHATPGQYTLKNGNVTVGTYPTIKAALDACDPELVPFAKRWAEYEANLAAPGKSFAQVMSGAKEKKPVPAPVPVPAAVPTLIESVTDQLEDLTLTPIKPIVVVRKEETDEMIRLLEKQWKESHRVKPREEELPEVTPPKKEPPPKATA